MSDVRDKGMAPRSDMRRRMYRYLRAGLPTSYEAEGNNPAPHADCTETIVGLPQVDDLFGHSTDNPGPCVVQIGTDAASQFTARRKAESAGNAVMNRSLVCLRLWKQQGKIPVVPSFQFQKQPKARKGLWGWRT